MKIRKYYCSDHHWEVFLGKSSKYHGCFFNQATYPAAIADYSTTGSQPGPTNHGPWVPRRRRVHDAFCHRLEAEGLRRCPTQDVGAKMAAKMGESLGEYGRIVT